MPKSVRIRTNLTINAAFNLSMSDYGTYSCRDEWMQTISIKLRAAIEQMMTKQDPSVTYPATLVQEHLAALLTNLPISADATIHLSRTTVLSEAEATAQEIIERYLSENNDIAYTVVESIDPFLREPSKQICFTGNAWALAAAWWFALIERLRPDTHGTSVSEILKNSSRSDDDLWYDTTDKAAHMRLWDGGSQREPIPEYWIITQSGPLYTRTVYSAATRRKQA